VDLKTSVTLMSQNSLRTVKVGRIFAKLYCMVTISTSLYVI